MSMIAKLNLFSICLKAPRQIYHNVCPVTTPQVFMDVFQLFLTIFLSLGYIDVLAQLTKVGDITEEKYQSKNFCSYTC